MYFLLVIQENDWFLVLCYLPRVQRPFLHGVYAPFKMLIEWQGNGWMKENMIKRNIFSSCSHLDVNPFWKRLRGVFNKEGL